AESHHLEFYVRLCLTDVAGHVNYFFFHAEDGIRARNVTGVQTCALPISLSSSHWMSAGRNVKATRRVIPFPRMATAPIECSPGRSEERRVGKECMTWRLGVVKRMKEGR